MSSNGKQAILTVNNLPRPQGTGLANGGNNGEKLKIVFHYLLPSGKGKKMYLWKYMFISISSKAHPEHISQLKRSGTH